MQPFYSTFSTQLGSTFKPIFIPPYYKSGLGKEASPPSPPPPHPHHLLPTLTTSSPSSHHLPILTTSSPSSSPDQLVSSLCTPCFKRSNGQLTLVGVAGVDLSLSEVLQGMDYFQGDSMTYAFIIDQEGNVSLPSPSFTPSLLPSPLPTSPSSACGQKR